MARGKPQKVNEQNIIDYKYLSCIPDLRIKNQEKMKIALKLKKKETKMNVPKVYDCIKEDLVDVTQQWCNTSQKTMTSLAMQREIARKVLSLNVIKDIKLIEEFAKKLTTYESK